MPQEEYSRVGHWLRALRRHRMFKSRRMPAPHSLHNAQQEHEPVDIINGIIIYTHTDSFLSVCRGQTPMVLRVYTHGVKAQYGSR